MTSPVYADIAKTAQERSGSQSQLEALSKSPWCENQYNTLNRFMTKYNLKRLDTMTVSSFEWDPSMGAGGGVLSLEHLRITIKEIQDGGIYLM